MLLFARTELQMPISNELRDLQDRMMGASADRAGKALQDRLVAEVRTVVAKLPGVQILTPPSSKNIEDARKKVQGDYGGDWLEIKDMARCTVVLETEELCAKAVFLIEQHFIARNGWSVFQKKITLAANDDGGYSGQTVFVATGGSKGEIQINNPALMYAKSLDQFLKNPVLGAMLPRLKATYSMVPGGLGHRLYVGFRRPFSAHVDPGKKFADASRIYYNYFRSSPPDMNLGRAAQAAILPLNLAAGGH